MTYPVSCRTNTFKHVVALVMLSVSAFAVGCQQESGDSKSENSDSSVQALTGPSGPEIVQRVQEVYRQAESYQDEATLHLSYQLQGKHLAEPHPWQVQFLRNRGFKADVFEARIRADKDQLACFVFDFASGNLDDQWQVHPRTDAALPLRRLFQDGICRHYITGQEDLPIHNTQPLAADAFFPPTVSLLTGQTDLAWLTRGTAERLADETIHGNPCYSVRVVHSQMSWWVFVDQENHLIRRIRYPIELLDGRLQDNPDVLDLEVVAEFKAATTQSNFASTAFLLDIPDNARQVRHFVAVPEAFPSSHVGKKVSDLGLRDASDQPADQTNWAGKVTLLCWTNQAIEEEKLLTSLKSAAADLSPKEYHVARVEIITGTLPGNPQVARRLTELEKQNGIPVLADYGFSSGRALGLDHYPMLAIIDRQGVLQFVKSLQDELVKSEDLAKVLLRVRSGDDVAGEMRQEYESFLDLYQERLANARVTGGAARDDGQLNGQTAPTHMTVTREWTNNNVQQPGNLRSRNADELTLLDGWRTIIQMDLEGREKVRKELDLESRESISIVRPGDKQKELSVVFSIMGRTVRVLDQKLIPIHTIEVNTDQQRIRDANLFDFDNDGLDELMISFTGPRGTEIIEVDLDRKSRRISNQSFRSATVLQRPGDQKSLVFCDANAKLRVIDSGDDDARDIPCDLVATTRIVARQDDEQLVMCAIGTNNQGMWTAVGLDENLKQIWSVPVGSQRFETQIESVAWACPVSGRRGLWVIASVDGLLKLISDDGKLVDQWQLGLDIRGLELVSRGNEYLLVISTDKDVQGWALSTGSSNAIPASAAR